MFNQYSVYGYLTQEQKELADGKFLNDILQLEKVNDFEAAYKFINNMAGQTLDGYRKLICPNDLHIGVIKNEESLEIIAWVKGQQVFGRGWKIPK